MQELLVYKRKLADRKTRLNLEPETLHGCVTWSVTGAHTDFEAHGDRQKKSLHMSSEQSPISPLNALLSVALLTFATEETSRATLRMPAVELPLKTSSVETPSRLQRLLGR